MKRVKGAKDRWKEQQKKRQEERVKEQKGERKKIINGRKWIFIIFR